MPVKKVDKIWMNGKFVNWDDAKIHVLAHVVHYGSSWFEGIRCYDTAKGPAIFRLDRHLRRLFDSTKIYRTEIPFTEQQVEDAIIGTIHANKMRACYIRPVVYRGYGDVGVNPLTCPVDLTIAVWEWGNYLGPEALTSGIDVCVSTWNRPAPNTLPGMAKAGGNYVLSQLMKVEALQSGYQEAIALDVNGTLSEGTGENIFSQFGGRELIPIQQGGDHHHLAGAEPGEAELAANQAQGDELGQAGPELWRDRAGALSRFRPLDQALMLAEPLTAAEVTPQLAFNPKHGCHLAL